MEASLVVIRSLTRGFEDRTETGVDGMRNSLGDTRLGTMYEDRALAGAESVPPSIGLSRSFELTSPLLPSDDP